MPLYIITQLSFCALSYMYMGIYTKQKIKNHEIRSREIKLALTSSVLSVQTHFFSQNGALVCFFPYISLDEASPSKKSPNSKKENFHEEEDDL